MAIKRKIKITSGNPSSGRSLETPLERVQRTLYTQDKTGTYTLNPAAMTELIKQVSYVARITLKHERSFAALKQKANEVREELQGETNDLCLDSLLAIIAEL